MSWLLGNYKTEPGIARKNDFRQFLFYSLFHWTSLVKCLETLIRTCMVHGSLGPWVDPGSLGPRVHTPQIPGPRVHGPQILDPRVH